MASVKSQRYKFSPQSIVTLRQRMGFSQSRLASLLGIPQNSLSRWETGATTPDAKSLAAIYSIGAEEGVVPNFFVKQAVKEPVQVRDVILVYWDIQNLTPSSPDVPALDILNLEPSFSNVETWDTFIRGEAKRRVPQAKKKLFKAFSNSMHRHVTDYLEKKGWGVWEDHGDWDEEIYDQAMSDSGQSPRRTVVFLVTADGDHSETVEELRKRGVRVYLIAPSTASDALVRAVGKKRWIRDGLPGTDPLSQIFRTHLAMM